MKKRIVKMLIVLLLTMPLTACNNSDKGINFQTKIIENHNSYNYKDYNNLTKIAHDFELALLDMHVNIESISFEYETYINGEFKTVTYKINSNISVTLKFNNSQNLMLANLKCVEQDDEDYNDIKRALLNWDYWNLSTEEILDCYDLDFDNDTKTVGDIKIEYSKLGFIISDTRYTN